MCWKSSRTLSVVLLPLLLGTSVWSQPRESTKSTSGGSPLPNAVQSVEPDPLSTPTPSGVTAVDSKDLAQSERYDYDKLRLERDLQKDFMEWAQTRFWLLTVIIVLGGFFGIRAFVREMIASELQDATRAAAKAEAAAEQTTQVTTQVRADAGKYRETVARLLDTATQLDTRFKALEGRISAEGAHAVASSELQLSQLASRVGELSNMFKTLASESLENRGLLQNYNERIEQIDQVAATRKAEFSENSKYFVEVVHHPKNDESTNFARELVNALQRQGYRASTGVWAETEQNQFERIKIRYKKEVDENFVAQVRDLTQTVKERSGVERPISIEKGLHVSFAGDVAIFLQADRSKHLL